MTTFRTKQPPKIMQFWRTFTKLAMISSASRTSTALMESLFSWSRPCQVYVHPLLLPFCLRMSFRWKIHRIFGHFSSNWWPYFPQWLDLLKPSQFSSMKMVPGKLDTVRRRKFNSSKCVTGSKLSVIYYHLFWLILLSLLMIIQIQNIKYRGTPAAGFQG